MRYIRTKDGIYEVISSNCGWEIPVYANNDFGEKYIQEDDIIKQADTIEELCDVYIEEYLDYKSVILKSDLYRGEDGSWRKEIGLPEHKIKIYGAIWVIDNNGAPTLKSVVKMNENGELELL